MIAVVLGATGEQGGAVARHLVEAGWDVRAVSRNPSAAVPGTSTVIADQDSADSSTKAFAGAAALAAGVPHLVYASLVAATAETGVASFDSKWAVEQHIADIGQPVTVLRPATFMDGLYAPGLPKLTHLLHPSVRYHLIAVDDIGAIAARVFADPAWFAGSSLTPAGDLLTPVEIAGLTGVEYEQFQVDDLELRKVFGDRAEPPVGIEASRALHPGLRTFADFLRAH